MIKIKKNNILICSLILSIAIAGTECKKSKEIPGEDGFKVILEETDNVPAEFYPDLLAEYRNKSWDDMINSAPDKYAKFFTKESSVTTIKIKNNKT
ncbi:MAG: hypothetical protein FWF73_02860, partial [Spirochaetes bacterium]|nr:hypothetical protein [Spirochaetota bacterium]